MRYTTTFIALIATTLPACLIGQPVSAEPLTVARLFADPDLSGPRLRGPKFSPDGRYVTYLQGKQDNKDQLDLWAHRYPRSGSARLLVDSRRSSSAMKRKLSAEEEARRERQRTASLRHSSNIQFSGDGKRLLIPLGGDLYLLRPGGQDRAGDTTHQQRLVRDRRQDFRPRAATSVSSASKICS